MVTDLRKRACEAAGLLGEVLREVVVRPFEVAQVSGPGRTGGDTVSGDLRFYTRADSAGPAKIVFSDYVMKSATLKPA